MTPNEKETKQILEMKAAGVPLVIGYAMSRDSSEIKSVIYAALPAKSKKPRVLWSKVWESDLYAHFKQQSVEGRLCKALKIPIKNVKPRSAVMTHADDSCRFASACVDLLKTGKYDKRLMPATPAACREYPRILMMDEGWCAKIDAVANPKPRKKRARAKKEDTNG